MMNNMVSIIKELKDYEAMKKQLESEMDKLKKQAIDYMTEAEIDEYVCDEGKVTYREVLSNKFNSTAFKKDFADIYAEYCKQTSAMRFTLN